MTIHAIKHHLTGAVLFECDVPGDIASGLRTRHVLEKAVGAGANLAGADLTGADGPQPATNEQAINSLDKVRAIVMDNQQRLDMARWHGDDGWKGRTCAEETLCDTAHCMAGWLQVCSGDARLRELEPHIAGTLAAPIAAKMFYRGNDETLAWLESRQYVQDIAEHDRRVAERKARKRATGSAS